MALIEQAAGYLGPGGEADLRARLLDADGGDGARPADALAQVGPRRVAEAEVGEGADEGGTAWISVQPSSRWAVRRQRRRPFFTGAFVF